MPTVHIDGWTTAEFIGSVAGQVVETIFTYKSEPPLTSEGDALALANLWRTTMQPLLINFLNNNFTLDRVVVKSHNATLPNVEGTSFFPAGTIGALTGDCSPGNVTIACKLLTGIAGRKNRGRQFMPGISGGITTLNIMTSAGLNLLQQIFVRHLLGWSVSGLVHIPAVASRKGVYLRVLISFVIDQYLDSQRRRLSGRGR